MPPRKYNSIASNQFATQLVEGLVGPEASGPANKTARVLRFRNTLRHGREALQMHKSRARNYSPTLEARSANGHMIDEPHTQIAN